MLDIGGPAAKITAEPELMYPETAAFKSTRPPGSGDLAQCSTGYSYSGFALTLLRTTCFIYYYLLGAEEFHTENIPVQITKWFA